MRDRIRPTLSADEAFDIISALKGAATNSLTVATEEGDPDGALSALRFHKRANELAIRLSDLMFADDERAKPQIAPGQITVDEKIAEAEGLDWRTAEGVMRAAEQGKKIVSGETVLVPDEGVTEGEEVGAS